MASDSLICWVGIACMPAAHPHLADHDGQAIEVCMLLLAGSTCNAQTWCGVDTRRHQMLGVMGCLQSLPCSTTSTTPQLGPTSRSHAIAWRRQESVELPAHQSTQGFFQASLCPAQCLPPPTAGTSTRDRLHLRLWPPPKVSLQLTDWSLSWSVVAAHAC